MIGGLEYCEKIIPLFIFQIRKDKTFCLNF